MSTSSLYSSSSSLNSLSKTASDLAGLGIWAIISIVLAIVGAILIVVLFTTRKNEGKFKGFVAWLYDFLSFKNMIVEIILKVTYLVIAIFITLYSLGLLFVSPLSALMLLVFGNVLVRVGYEFSLMMIMLCRNTSDINSKLSKKEAKVEEDKTQE